MEFWKLNYLIIHFLWWVRQRWTSSWSQPSPACCIRQASPQYPRTQPKFNYIYIIIEGVKSKNIKFFFKSQHFLWPAKYKTFIPSNLQSAKNTDIKWNFTIFKKIHKYSILNPYLGLGCRLLLRTNLLQVCFNQMIQSK